MKNNINKVLEELGLDAVNTGVCTGAVWHDPKGDILYSISPADGTQIAGVQQASLEDYERVVTLAGEAFLQWRKKPAPLRGDIVQIGRASCRERVYI